MPLPAITDETSGINTADGQTPTSAGQSAGKPAKMSVISLTALSRVPFIFQLPTTKGRRAMFISVTFQKRTIVTIF
jgi:hypothetical protein